MNNAREDLKVCNHHAGTAATPIALGWRLHDTYKLTHDDAAGLSHWLHVFVPRFFVMYCSMFEYPPVTLLLSHRITGCSTAVCVDLWHLEYGRVA